MIPVIIKPAEDELFSSWLKYLAEENGMSMQEFQKMYLHNPGGYAERAETRYIFELCQKYKNGVFPDAEEVFYKHMTQHVTLNFVRLPHQARVIGSMFYPYHSPETDFFNNHFQERDEYRVCPECAKEDLETHGRIIVHVPHAVPGVTCCYRHRKNLIKLDEYMNGTTASDEADGIEVQIARFVKEIYDHRDFLCETDIRRAINIVVGTQKKKSFSLKVSCANLQHPDLFLSSLTV